MATNSIAFAKNYTGIVDEVYKKASVSSCLDSGRRMVRAGRNAHEIMIPNLVHEAGNRASTWQVGTKKSRGRMVLGTLLV